MQPKTSERGKGPHTGLGSSGLPYYKGEKPQKRDLEIRGVLRGGQRCAVYQWT